MRGDSYKDVLDYFADDPRVGMEEDWLEQHGISLTLNIRVEPTNALGPGTDTVYVNDVPVAHLLVDSERITIFGVLVGKEEQQSDGDHNG